MSERYTGPLPVRLPMGVGVGLKCWQPHCRNVATVTVKETAEMGVSLYVRRYCAACADRMNGSRRLISRTDDVVGVMDERAGADAGAEILGGSVG